ncbi:MAG: phosphatase [Actinobacteria bacterium]|nr:phosphatase [Actinomycetota bacterium]
MAEETRIKADLHVHTISSGHAYSTVREICEVAAERGLELVGITDHGPAMPGGPHLYHFTNLIVLPRVLSGVNILRSAECNIIDVDGNLDVHDKALEGLDLVQAGLHPFCGYEGKTVGENTQAVLGAIQGGKVDILVHPGNPWFPLDYRTVVEAAASNGVLLEVNNASFTVIRKGSEKNCREILKEAKRTGAKVCVGSDAHEASMVGRFEKALALIGEVGIDEDLIVNRGMKSVLEFLRSRGKEISF